MSTINPEAHETAGPHRRAAALAVAIAAALALCGCGSKNKIASIDQARDSVATMKARSVAVIDDTPRDKKVASLLEQVDQLLAAIHQNRVELDRTVSRLNASYSSPRESFDEALEQFNSRQAQLQNKLIAVRHQLVQLTEAGEWTAMSRPSDGSTPMFATAFEP